MRRSQLFFSLLLASLASLFGASAPAQIMPDQTLEQAETSVVTPNVTLNGESVELVEGGAIRGTNLFHSFSDFNVAENARVYFFNPAQVDTILSRVTGDRPSNILGTLGVNGAADLFLINPNGILFGPQATLDIEGSFYATTAEAIDLGNGTFSAINPTQSQLLNVQPNTSFFTHLTPRSGNIEALANLQVGGTLGLAGTNLSLGGRFLSANSLSLMATYAVQANILISRGSTAVLAGGDAVLGTYAGDSLHVLAGGAALVGQVTILEADNSAAVITPATFPILANVETANGQSVTIDGSTTATLDIRAGIDWAELARASAAQTGQFPPGQFPIVASPSALPGANAGVVVGNVRLQAPEGLVFLSSQFEPNSAFLAPDIVVGELVTGDVEGTFRGSAGSVLLDSRGAIAIRNRIATESLFGNGGNITLTAEGPVLIDSSSLATAIGDISDLPNVSRRAGNIDIESSSFFLRNGQVTTDSNTVGDSGNLTIRARDAVVLQGFPSGVVTILSTGIRPNGDGSAGKLTIRSRELLVESAQISSSISGAGRVGELNITATERVDLSGELLSSSGNIFPGGVFAQVDVDDEGSGNRLTIRTPRLDISNGSKVQVGSFGNGDAGILVLRAAEINLFNTVQPFFFTGAFAGVLQDPTSSTTLPEGDGGQVNIYTDRLSVRDGARVTADLSGTGEGGDIFIRATELLEVVGVGRSAPSTVGAEIAPPGVTTPIAPEQVAGRSGDVTIEATRLSLRDGGQISVSTFGNGASGDIQIRESQQVEIVGRSPDNLPSAISAQAGENASGDGGNITINAHQLALRAGGEVNARSEGVSRAGNITLNLADQLTAEDGDIRTSSASAAGGAIEINARTVMLLGDSDIRTDVSRGEGTGGNITVTANAVIAFDDSDILAFANDGTGGNILLNTPAFFGEDYVPDTSAPFDGNAQVDVNASGSLASGSIVIPEVDFIENDLSELSDDLTAAEQLVANSCIVRSAQTTGTLTLGGVEGVSQTPSEPLVAAYPAGAVQSIAFSTASGTTETTSIESTAIHEPQAIYQIADGRWVMSRDCEL